MWQGLNWKIRFKRNQKWSKRIFPFTVLLLVGFFNCFQFALPSTVFPLSVIVSLRASQSGWWFFSIHFVCIVLVDSIGVLYVQGFFFFLKTWNFFIITDKNVFFHLEKKMEKWRDWKVFFYKILKNSWEKCVFSLWTFSQTWFWSFVFRLMVNFVPFSILCL